VVRTKQPYGAAVMTPAGLALAALGYNFLLPNMRRIGRRRLRRPGTRKRESILRTLPASISRIRSLPQINGHEILRTIQEDYFKAGTEAVNTTKLVLGTINEHLSLLTDLRHTRLASL